MYYIKMNFPPLNLASIGSYLLDLGIEVEIFDAKAKNCNYKKLKRKILKFKPDLVGISVYISAIVNESFKLANIIKEINPNIVVVFGGRHPTFESTQILKRKEVDIVVRGEGEITFRELISKGNPLDIKGLSYKTNGIVKHNPDRQLMNFSEIRLPARHLLNDNKYWIYTVRLETIESSRGCPHSCKFCITPNLYKRTWRPRPVESIINELKIISRNRKISDIFFVDDNLTVNTKRVEYLCERIIECKKNGQLRDLKFFAQIRVDAVVKSPHMVKKMSEAGFWVVLIGIESIYKDTLKKVSKNFNFLTVLKAIKILHDNNIIVVGNMIIGVNLNEKEEDIKKEIEFLSKVDIDILTFSILTPFPGTSMIQEFEKKNLIISKNWSRYTIIKPVIRTYSMSPKKLTELFLYSFQKIKYINNQKGLLSRAIKRRGILFLLNPVRFIMLLRAFIKMRLFFKALNKNEKTYTKRDRIINKQELKIISKLI